MENITSSTFQRISQWLKESLIIKLLAIGFIILILLIPNAMIQGLISERDHRQDEVAKEVSQSWGGNQEVEGPVLSVPYSTWQIWEDHKMEWDSTLYYAEAAGFRCGTCWPFPVFNFLTRQPLKLKEIPLTLMEGTFLNYLKLSPEEMMAETVKIFNRVKAYNGTFVLLWHNSIIDLPEWKPYAKVYEQFFELID